MRWSFAFVMLAVGFGCTGDDPSMPFTGSWLVRGSGTTASLRGLHVVDAEVAWASGSGGTFLRTVDGAETWEIGMVAGAEALDFRDVHAWDRDRALLLSAGLPARIYRTDDGGESWQLMYENETPGVFFNAVSFWDEERGIAVGDPIDGRFLIIRTDDGGETWTELPWNNRPQALEGEANFAASGTCMTVLGKDSVWFGTGGPAARVFRSTDGGSSWQRVAMVYPGSSPYTNDACGLGTGDFFTGTQTTYSAFTADLSAWAGQGAILRWEFSSDGSQTGDGWWIDEISITDVAVLGSCIGADFLFADGFESGGTSAWSQ